ncbi:TRAP transporter substrate-binding protein [Microbaculum marinum]|uniref:TRAP transporter substrate-binding protein n=1 Tax=Microbaculum marinum TaxID=1764581 RepID=A0AAW9RGJ7_9HYPH
MKRYLSAAAIVPVLAVAMTCSANAEPKTIRVDTYAGPQHAVNAAGLDVWAKQVEEASNGELKVELSYPPINPRDIMDRVRSGITDVGWITHGYTTGRFVLTDMVELPGNGGNAEQASRAYWKVYNEEFADLGEHKGVVPIALFVHGPGMIHTSKPIESIDDLEGLKIRTGGGTQGEIAKRLGLVTVSAPVTKAQELLSQGVADGVLFSLETIKSFNLGDIVTYHYGMPDNLYTSSMAIVINENFLDSLTDSQKEAFWSVSGEELSGLIGSAWDGADTDAEETFGADSVVTFDGEMKDKVDAALAGMDEEWVARAQEAGADDAAEVLEKYRAEIQNQKSAN